MKTMRGLALPFLLAVAACSVEDGKIKIDTTGYEAPTASELDTPDQKRIWEDGCAYLASVPPRGEDGERQRYSLPLLTIYRDGEPVAHAAGFNETSSVETWSDVADGTRWGGASSAPSLDAVLAATEPAKGSGDAPAAADLTFVRYAADWCAPCKGQSAAIKDFRAARPDLAIVHYEVEADMQRWAKEGTLKCSAG